MTLPRCTGRQYRRRHGGGFVSQIGKERCAEVSLRGVGQNRDDEFSIVFGTTGDLAAREYRRAGRDPGEQPFGDHEVSCRVDCLIAGDMEDLVDQVGLQNWRHEVGANPLNFVGGSLAARKEWRFLRLDRNYLE